MFNFLVSWNEDDWYGEPFSLEESRFLESTDDDIRSKYKALNPEQLAEIIKMPTIFAYESPREKDPCFGFIRSVKKRKGTGRSRILRIEYEVIRIERFLSREELREEDLCLALDISEFELRRSHWAIKDADLGRELARQGIYLPSWVQGKADEYVNSVRIAALKSISSEKFDLSKIIKLCEELNLAYANGSYFSIAMLLRAILDHVPPIFGQPNFNCVVGQYGGVKDHRSFKDLMSHLNNGARKIADEAMHKEIRRRVNVPTYQQVDFRQHLDRLLQEVISILDVE